jgi:hypothetical protein
MKKIIYLLALILLASCATEFGKPNSFSYTTTEITDTLKSTVVDSTDTITDTIPDVFSVEKMFFRGSELAFWEFNDIDDIDSLINGFYDNNDNKTRPDMIYLSNTDSSILFERGQTITTKVDDAASLQYKRYNLIKLDAGAGYFTFIDNKGNIIGTIYPSGSGSEFICRSILFVDNTYLSSPKFISKNTIRNCYTSGNFNIGSPIVNKILENSGPNGLDLVDTFNDAYGNYDCLLIPFSPVDLAEYTELNVNINLQWDIDGSLNEVGTRYVMQSRVAGCCFDFKIIMTAE